MNIICIWHNAPVMLLNKTANSVLHDILHRIYQCNLYFLNIIWFQGTRAKIMSCTSVRKVWHSMCQFSRKSCMLNSFTFRSLIPNFIQRDNICGKVQIESHIHPQVRYGFQCSNFHKNSKSLNIFLWTSHVPNFIHIRQKM
jgi:hypothetical protein